jgi:hypothetical protein
MLFKLKNQQQRVQQKNRYFKKTRKIQYELLMAAQAEMLD